MRFLILGCPNPTLQLRETSPLQRDISADFFMSASDFCTCTYTLLVILDLRGDVGMHPSDVVYLLGFLIALLAAIAAGIGLFWRGSGEAYAFTTHRGQDVQILGRGLYRDDTVFVAQGFRAQDIVTLFLAVPALIIAIFWSRSGSLGGHLLLTGVFAYVLYGYASLALGAAYNRLFLLYTALSSASLFALILMFRAYDTAAFSTSLSEDAPQNSIAIFMILSGIVTLFVWGLPLIDALRRDTVPDRVDIYTTPITFALDLAVITPSTFLAGMLLLQGDPLGYLVAVALLVIIVFLTPYIALATVFQQRAGVNFTPGEMIGPVVGFAILGIVALWLLISLLGSIRG